MPEPAPANQPEPGLAEKFVAETQALYTDQLALARDAAATTGTAGWAALYKANREGYRQAVNAAVKHIGAFLDIVKLGGHTTEDEKELKEGVKSITEARERLEGWLTSAVAPFRAPVIECAELRRKIKQRAQDEQAEGPLVMRGLADEVAAIVDAWPRPAWDDATGRVVIEDPKPATA